MLFHFQHFTEEFIYFKKNMNTSKFLSVFFIFFSILISSTYAHFDFQNPPYRGHDEDLMSQPPCGGFNNVNTSAITQFPVTGDS
jgi:hypothetical protein